MDKGELYSINADIIAYKQKILYPELRLSNPFILKKNSILMITDYKDLVFCNGGWACYGCFLCNGAIYFMFSSKLKAYDDIFTQLS